MMEAGRSAQQQRLAPTTVWVLGLAELHGGLRPADDDDRLFALAELSFLHADRTGDRAHFLASAVYAWALLFPGDATGDEELAATLRRPPTAIDNMNPRHPGLLILASIPVPSRIPAHSIIAVKGDGPKEEGDDGVVTYRSAHIDEVVSELVVRWDHSCQGQPQVIEEIRRILLEHAATPGISHP